MFSLDLCEYIKIKINKTYFIYLNKSKKNTLNLRKYFDLLVVSKMCTYSNSVNSKLQKKVKEQGAVLEKQMKDSEKNFKKSSVCIFLRISG